MGYIEALILGIVQGLTEFLPISSSAHLRIVGDLFGWGDPGAAFTAIIQLGTEAAVIAYFAKDIWRIIVAWFASLRSGVKGSLMSKDPDVRMGWIVIIGTLPISILGLAFSDFIESTLRNLILVAIVLAVFAVLLGYADRTAKQSKVLESMTIRDGFIVGLGQAMALIPGVSRSGGTITVGLLLGYTREAAARVSFLLAIPAVVLSGFYQLAKSSGDGALAVGPTLLATIISFTVGYAVIVWFLKLISTKSFMPFVRYRIVLAILVLIGVAANVLAVY